MPSKCLLLAGLTLAPPFPSAVLLNTGRFLLHTLPPTPATRAMSPDIGGCVITQGVEGAIGIWWAEVRGAAEHPLRLRHLPSNITKNCPAPNVNSAEAEKPGSLIPHIWILFGLSALAFGVWRFGPFREIDGQSSPVPCDGGIPVKGLSAPRSLSCEGFLLYLRVSGVYMLAL